MNKEHYLALYKIAQGSLASDIDPAIASVLLDKKLIEYKGERLKVTWAGVGCLCEAPDEAKEAIANDKVTIGEFRECPPDRLTECPVCKDFYEVVCIAGGVIAHCPLCRDVRSVTPYRAMRWMADWFRQTTGREPDTKQTKLEQDL